jgi:hypothetical protein
VGFAHPGREIRFSKTRSRKVRRYRLKLGDDKLRRLHSLIALADIERRKKSDTPKLARYSLIGV